jgi:hypothetical protein
LEKNFRVKRTWGFAEGIIMIFHGAQYISLIKQIRWKKIFGLNGHEVFAEGIIMIFHGTQYISLIK